jgi:large subunit ribosomal protein L29
MIMKELREKNIGELTALLTQLKEEAFKLRMQMGVENNAKTHEFPRIRHDVARIETVLTQKRRGNI